MEVFFKQHAWTDGRKIEAKYTSRAAELYKQMLSKEVAKSVVEDTAAPSSPIVSQSEPMTNGFSDFKIADAPKETSSGKQEAPEVSRLVKPPAHSVFIGSVKKPIGTKKGPSKTGGLGARKLTTKPNESLYDQKPEEPAPVVTSTMNASTKPGSSYISRFEYVENGSSTVTNSGGTQVISHVSPPKSSGFFSDFGVDNGFQKKSSSTTSKVQTQETNEARQKFSNAKSISSSQFFGDQNKAKDMVSQVSLQKFSSSSAISSADLFGHDMDDSSLDLSASDFINRISFQASQDISSLSNIAGETGKKLTSIASNLLTDLQDRIL